MRTFWDMEKFRYEDMPTLHELFDQADPLELVRTVLEKQGRGFFEAGDEGYPASVSKIIKIQSNIIATEPNASAAKTVVIPREYYQPDYLEPRIDYSLEADWIELEDVSKASDVLLRTHRVAACDELVQLHKNADGDDLHITSYSLAFASWSDVLAAKVWLGSDWSREVAYELLASVLWELTFNGPDAAATDNAIEELHEEYEEAKNGASIPMELCEGLRPLGVELPRAERPHELAADVLAHNAEIDFLERVDDLARRLDTGGEWGEAK